MKGGGLGKKGVGGAERTSHGEDVRDEILNDATAISRGRERRRGMPHFQLGFRLKRKGKQEVFLSKKLK